MGYGTSLGTAHEDEISYVMEKGLNDRQLADQSEINQNETSGDFQSRFGASDTPLKKVYITGTDDSTMPLEASRKLTDALKTYGAPGTPGNDYETKLTPDLEDKYNQKFGPEDSKDYDMRGWLQANPNADPNASGVHYPDTFKKPNHPTFSDQSMYHSPDTQGGKWTTDDQGKDVFTPGPQNLKNGISVTQDYLKQNDPNVTLNYKDPGFFGRLSMVNAVKGMGAGATDAVTNFPQHIKEGIDSVIKMVKTPGEGFENKLPPFVQDPDTGETKVNPQAIEWATNTAMTMVGAPAPVAAKMADGTLGSFMGVKSKTIDKTKLYKAQEMEMNGFHPDDIWEDTGTFRGADNRWRQEVNDKQSNLKIGNSGLTSVKTITDNPTGWTSPKNHGEVTETVSIPSRFEGLNNAKTIPDLLKALSSPDSGQKVLGDILDHPKLYDAYPWLQNIKVYPLPKDSPYYGMARGGNEIHMNELSPDEFHSTLMHEVQHLIQTHEGFAQGANPDMFLPKELKAAEENFLKIRDEALSNTERELGNATRVGEMQQAVRAETLGIAKPGTIFYERLSFLKEKHPEIYNRLSNIDKSEKLLSEAKTTASNKYKSTMGEVESRNVQARLDMDATMRFLNSPQSTEKIIMDRKYQHDPHKPDRR